MEQIPVALNFHRKSYDFAIKDFNLQKSSSSFHESIKS